jgi:hypothetical protein
MGKRGDKRRARKKRRQPRQPDIEGFQFGPLTVERRGKNIVSRVDPEHPQYQAFRALMKTQIAGLPDELAKLRDELRTLFAPYDAFDVVANLWLVNVPADPETYRESMDEGLLAIPEVAASIMIERKTRAGTDSQALFGEIGEEAQEKLKQFLQVQSFIYLEEARTRHEDDPVYGEIRGLARAHRLAVRGPSYWWQERQTILDLFEDDVIMPLVRDETGFTASEAIALAEAMTEIGLARLRDRVQEARAFSDRLLEDDARSRRGESPLHTAHGRIVDDLKSLGRAAAVKRVRNMALAWAGFAPGSTMEFTTKDLAEEAGLAEDVAGAFLGRFAIPLGAFSERERPPDIEDLREQPVLTDGDGHHFCVSPHNVFWGIRPHLEAALKQKPKNFERYERRRATLIEDRAVKALSTALHAEWWYTDLHYELTENGETKTVELDGIVRLDSVVFVVEVKASSMRPSARRAAPDALRDWLRDELSKAAMQARRARDALFGATQAPITDKQGKPMTLDLEGVEDVIEIVVTLEDLPAIAPSSWKLADAGLVPSDPVPWVVSLHELEIICEVSARPAEFVHYTMRRQRLDTRRDAWALDELDYFMHYVLSGLYWEGEVAGVPIRLLSHTDDLDAYYAYATGHRQKKAKRPAPKHKSDVEQLLTCLDGLDMPGRLDAALAILDVDVPFRERITGDLRRLRQESAADGALHDRSYLFGDFGITVMSAPPSASKELSSKLVDYCRLKKHQVKANKWIGFGVYEGPPEPAQLAVVIREPWQPDAELDELVKSMPSYGVEGDFDGRKLAKP